MYKKRGKDSLGVRANWKWIVKFKGRISLNFFKNYLKLIYEFLLGKKYFLILSFKVRTTCIIKSFN